MPTFKVQLYGEYNKEAEKRNREFVIIEADRMEVFRYGDLGFMKGTLKGRDCLVQTFADGQWERAWVVGQQELAEPEQAT